MLCYAMLCYVMLCCVIYIYIYIYIIYIKIEIDIHLLPYTHGLQGASTSREEQQQPEQPRTLQPHESKSPMLQATRNRVQGFGDFGR